ncbi:hypothetical protein CHARACLAT_028314 [Characodon lateralis]|uniref:Uncharacterized protein n=1 Tax=Characodon lateralis TaxID=208331 RepID=A0ABU7EE90_9TELE|nr:hypothetical protein [Characodon lateralis]
MDPETQDPGTYHSTSRGPTVPNGPGPGKQPPGVSRHTPKHPAPDTKNHKYTSGQRHQPLTGRGADTQWGQPDPGGGPLLSGLETGRLPQHLNLDWRNIIQLFQPTPPPHTLQPLHATL